MYTPTRLRHAASERDPTSRRVFQSETTRKGKRSREISGGYLLFVRLNVRFFVYRDTRDVVVVDAVVKVCASHVTSTRLTTATEKEIERNTRAYPAPAIVRGCANGVGACRGSWKHSAPG